MAQNNNKHIGNDLELHNVLVSRFSAMGDVVMTIPVVYSACLRYPDIRFIMITRPSLTGLYINPPANLTVLGIDLHGQYSGIAGARRLVGEMRTSYDIDAYIDLQNDRSTTLIAWLCRLHGIKTVRRNRAMHNQRMLTRRTNKVMLPLVSARARYREAFFKTGLPLEGDFNGLYGSRKADPALFANITDRPKGSEKWIGIAPFAAYPEKEYPIIKMEEVIRMLSENPDYHIFIFGGADRETEIAAHLAKTYPRVTSLAGNKYGFPAELALLSNLDVMLTMDSANMHLAAMVGTPTVSIWGATHHYCGFKGWHQSETDMVQAPLSCRPCSIKGDHGCYRHDLLCLTAIRPDTVYQKLLEKINV